MLLRTVWDVKDIDSAIRQVFKSTLFDSHLTVHAELERMKIIKENHFLVEKKRERNDLRDLPGPNDN